MSLTLISQSYLVESDSDFGGEGDEVEEAEKLAESSESIVKSYMKSKWDYDEDETIPIPIGKFICSPPDIQPECQVLGNLPSESLPIPEIPADIFDLTPPEAGSVIEKQLPTPIGHSSLFEVSSRENTDVSRTPHYQSRRAQKKKVKTSRRNPRQLNRSSFKTAAELKVQTLYKCPYCLLIFAVADDLIQHLPSHDRKDSTFLNTENADSSNNSKLKQAGCREKLRQPLKPAKSGKVLPAKTSKNSNSKLKKEVHILRSCEIKLTRCDNLLSSWKRLPTKTKNFDLNKNCLARIRGVTKLRIAGIQARTKMKQMLEEDDNKFGEQPDSQVSEKSKGQSTNSNALEPTGFSKLRHHVEEQTSHPWNGVKWHSMKRPYICQTCLKGFGRKDQLQTHFLRIHAAEKPYKCPICSKGFRAPNNIKRHIRTHTGEKSYKCSTCSKGFTQSSQLKGHIRTHTGEKPYKCPTCSKGFTQSSQLKGHIRTHTGEKPYKCPTCSKGFTQSSQLKGHIRTHTGEKPYKCPTCSKAFTQSSQLKGHIRTHTGEKPYKCPTCSKGFAQSRSLKRHIRIHTGEKPY